MEVPSQAGDVAPVGCMRRALIDWPSAKVALSGILRCNVEDLYALRVKAARYNLTRLVSNPIGGMMAARSIASVYLTFGLVSIPVKVYSATQSSAGISFNLLHKTDGSRLKQQYLCIKENLPVER